MTNCQEAQGFNLEPERTLLEPAELGDGVEAGVDVQLLVGALDVLADGVDADPERVGNFLVLVRSTAANQGVHRARGR